MSDERVVVEQLLAVCAKAYISHKDTNDKTLSALHAALAEVKECMGISQAKSTHGTEGEMWIAKKFKLKWETEKVHGSDAISDQGLACEIKSAVHPSATKIAKKKTKINVDYSTPARLAGETDDAWCDRTRDHYLKDAGGHYWGSWKAVPDPKTGERVVLSWWIPCDSMARLIAHKMRRSSGFKNLKGSASMNFGGIVCVTCGKVHRIEALVKALGGWSSTIDEEEELLDEVWEKISVSDDTIEGLCAGTVMSQCPKE